MQKYFSSWIRHWFRSIVVVIVTALLVMNCTTVAVAGGVASNPKSFTIASFWNKEYSRMPEITVYRTPSCGCCGAWVEHMQKHGFQIEDIKTDEIEAIKQKYNLPQNLASCHTAIINGYVMEGHIPANDIKGFLKQKPNLAGLAVPGMPVGTPGMEVGNRKQPFAVVAFDSNGEVKVFKKH